MAKNTYQIWLIGAALIVSLAFSATLAAHDCDEKSASAGTPMVYADQDRDGRVTQQEATVDRALSRNFERYDQNDDGELDRAEFAQLEARSSNGVRDGMDAGHDMEWNGFVTHDVADTSDNPLRPRLVVHPTPQ